MNHQYNNSKLVAAINGLTNSSSHSNLIPQQQLHHNNQHIQQTQPVQQQQTTTDAIIVQSNSSVVSDEFIIQLQEQFGGDNKQIYILNNNQVLNQSNSGHSSSNGDNSNQVQYLIVDKDVDINVILQDPNIFNQVNQNSNQQQPQQQLYLNNSVVQHSSNDLSTVQTQQHIHQTTPKPTYLPKQQFTNQNSSTSRYGVTNGLNQVQAIQKNTLQIGSNSLSPLIQNNNPNSSQPNLIEESIQRVQVPPPKRKQFEFKLENKKNSYQDVFLRFLAGEKQPTLEIVSEHTSKKPKDNLYLNQTTSSVSNSANKFIPSQAPSKVTITNNVIPSQSMNLSNTNNNQITNGTAPTITLDKENYYNSSRRENLLPLNNYEYRNSYKDHYDNQGVRVNPAVLKNLSYTSSGVTTDAILGIPAGRVAIPQTSNRMINQNGKIMSANVMSQTQTSGNMIDNGSRGNSKSPIVMAKSNQVQLNSVNSNVASNNELNQLFGYANSIIDNNSVDSSVEARANNIKINKTQIELVTELEGVINSNTTSNLAVIDHDKSIPKSDAVDAVIPQINDKVLDPVQGNENVISQSNGINNHSVVTDKMILNNQSAVELEEEVTFGSGEFLIHKSTFSGDYENYDIWCVLDDGYLQKYEPVLLASGERCHQSADVLAQYTADKSEFLLVKVDEKGKTEQNNIVVGVLPEYEPRNRKYFLNQQIIPNIYNHTNTEASNPDEHKINTNMSVSSSTAAATAIQPNQALNNSSSSNSNVVVVTYDDLKTTLDVFLQVLLSQHLNSEFLLRIKELQDEYFKPSIEFIDTILNEKYALLINSFSHFMNLKKTNTTKSTHTEYILNPLFKYMFESKPKLISQQATTHGPTKCQAVDSLNQITEDPSLIATYLIKFDGLSYNSDTLTPITNINELNPLINEQMEKEGAQKEFLVCAKTLQFIQLCHSVKHLKINFYEICQHKIEQVKLLLNENVNQVASDILNYCLADTDWLLEMFEKFKRLLFDVDSLLSDDQNSIIHLDNSNVIMSPVVMASEHSHNSQIGHIGTDTGEIVVNSSSLNEHSNGVGSVQTNKLINDQISQIITNVEGISNEMETS